ncbi:hypothetical protein [Paenibacillus guangzhouensis]|uniref:hypothetical protein n=1 Tax=Paenibacillus guangzhouensis TaxID=1473112 RepID=UPI0012673978|nr:hypothetical protein [Paenibacillus guangzhouensis]
MDNNSRSHTSKPIGYLNQVDLAQALSPKNPTDIQLSIEDIILAAIHQSKLIRFTVNKGRGIQQSIPGRILDFDPNRSMIHVYHVDEKQVYILNLTEIDEFIV